ncbi:MAG: recombination mediator RecR [Patescibacteria group bacterium]
MNEHIIALSRMLQKLPGVGPRQALRFVLALMNHDERDLVMLGDAIARLRTAVQTCTTCFNISDGDTCRVCGDAKRDPYTILVLEKVTDLESVERTGLYRGRYHVLGGSIHPADGVTADNLRIHELVERVSNLAHPDRPVEVILATNAHAPGETTALYIESLLRPLEYVRITKLARGLSSGTHVEYADEMTLKNALDFRK